MFIRALIVVLTFNLGTMSVCADDSPIVHYSAAARFADVRDDLDNAITARGLVVEHISHVGVMLDRTGKDLGKTKHIYKEDQGQVFSFCSSVLSRRIMEADSLNIVFCPFTIAVFSTLEDLGTVHVAYRRPQRTDGDAQSNAALLDVEKLLDGIAREALHFSAQ